MKRFDGEKQGESTVERQKQCPGRHTDANSCQFSVSILNPRHPTVKYSLLRMLEFLESATEIESYRIPT
jgi:hypothetical protein